MKKINSMALAAMLIGGGVAFATNNSTKAQETIKWRPLYNIEDEIMGWQNVNDQEEGLDYLCKSSSRICTAEFPVNVTPSPNSNPLSSTSGDYE